MKLSPHFSLYEFEYSETASRMDIYNVPSPKVVDALTLLCEYLLEPIRDHFNAPIRITSGYRSPELNKAIGSKSTSQHIKGEAADFVVSGVTPYEASLTIAGLALPFDQLIHEFDSWTHISYSTKERGEALTINKHGTHRGIV